MSAHTIYYTEENVSNVATNQVHQTQKNRNVSGFNRVYKAMVLRQVYFPIRRAWVFTTCNPVNGLSADTIFFPNGFHWKNA